jgi:hypothetical protein
MGEAIYSDRPAFRREPNAPVGGGTLDSKQSTISCQAGGNWVLFFRKTYRCGCGRRGRRTKGFAANVQGMTLDAQGVGSETAVSHGPHAEEPRESAASRSLFQLRAPQVRVGAFFEAAGALRHEGVGNRK